MKKFIGGTALIVCALAMVGWGSVDDSKIDRNRSHDRDDGYRSAERDHQGDDEDVKRSQGDESGRRDIHDNKKHEYEEGESSR